MKKDITSRTDIEFLVNQFYLKVRDDESLGPIFDQKFNVNWDTHLVKMYSFWESILFHTGTFNGNPMKKHKEVHQTCPFTQALFERWLHLFNETVNQNFEGEIANQAKVRALSIATVMQIKILYPSDPQQN